jgi:hypothetical protein
MKTGQMSPYDCAYVHNKSIPTASKSNHTAAKSNHTAATAALTVTHTTTAHKGSGTACSQVGKRLLLLLLLLPLLAIARTIQNFLLLHTLL